MSASRIGQLLFASLVFTGCGGAPLAAGSTQTTEPAMLERRVNVAFGGYAWWIQVDSAAATLQVKCEQVSGGRVGTPCASIPARTVQLTASDVRALFAVTRQSDFAALKAEYDMSGTFVDGPAYSVKVIANGRQREIRWSDAANPLPNPLRTVSDRMLALAGIGG